MASGPWRERQVPPQLHGGKNVPKKPEPHFQMVFCVKWCFEMVQKGFINFSASIRDQIGSNGIIASSFFKKQGRKKDHFGVFLGHLCPPHFSNRNKNFPYYAISSL